MLTIKQDGAYVPVTTFVKKDGTYQEAQVSVKKEGAYLLASELPIPDTVPVNTRAPIITGNTTAGSVLTYVVGAWDGHPAPVITHEWLSNGVVVGNGATYTVTVNDEGKTITVRETATNIVSAVSVNSNGIAIPLPNIAPANITPPVINGVAGVGEVLTCTPGTWSGRPVPALTYQWKSGAVNVGVGLTYTVTDTDQGADITCVETATNVVSAVQAASNIISIPAAP